ncbi:MAG: hypothetical protein U5L45_09835 [Saprospiraceae bacterium]|nr:hypothetical protein [Saprospiraceae bacterium]
MVHFSGKARKMNQTPPSRERSERVKRIYRGERVFDSEKSKIFLNQRHARP